MAFLFNFQCKYTIILDKVNIEINNFLPHVAIAFVDSYPAAYSALCAVADGMVMLLCSVGRRNVSLLIAMSSRPACRIYLP